MSADVAVAVGVVAFLLLAAATAAGLAGLRGWSTDLALWGLGGSASHAVLVALGWAGVTSTTWLVLCAVVAAAVALWQPEPEPEAPAGAPARPTVPEPEPAPRPLGPHDRLWSA